MYGDDYAASKVAGHELKSLISYVNCEVKDLHFPLMALVDYRGYRILAMSVLPINKQSIRYGTDDAGATIYAANQVLPTLCHMGLLTWTCDLQQLLKLLESSATRLNLKPHQVRAGKPPVCLLCCGRFPSRPARSATRSTRPRTSKVTRGPMADFT
jgi:hypothetical protein